MTLSGNLEILCEVYPLLPFFVKPNSNRQFSEALQKVILVSAVEPFSVFDNYLSFSERLSPFKRLMPLASVMMMKVDTCVIMKRKAHVNEALNYLR